MSIPLADALFANNDADCISVEVMLAKRQLGIPVIDVRSPAEYRKGHIPGAQNIPLLLDDERAIVGTVYFQNGKDKAIRKGLEIIGPKLAFLSEQGLNLARNNEIIVYCWRGGMRSASLAWLLRLSGLTAYTIQGGYKAYRRYVHEYFANDFHFVVIGGMTGSGKTEILKEIKKLGYPVINLEELASHKGSVFGGIGELQQPTTEQFENKLFDEITKYPLHQPVFIEDESITIGSVFIPKSFHRSMSDGILINLIVPIEQRVQNLAALYGGADKDILIHALKKIEKRLGLKATRDAINYISEGNIPDAVSIVLKYYDKIYTRTMHTQHVGGKIIHVEPEGSTADDKAVYLTEYLKINKIL